MVKMFEDSADFSGIFETSQPMKVSKVLHKAFINVTEYGCVAAAATCETNPEFTQFLSELFFYCLLFLAVGISFRIGGSDCPPSTAYFKADHPFLFHIMDVTKGILLFSGRYVNPSNN